MQATNVTLTAATTTVANLANGGLHRVPGSTK